jgi:citrate lyase beta subunit
MDGLTERLDAMLAGDDAERVQRYPGTALGRQPVHTIYVPADRFTTGTVTHWRDAALESLEVHRPLPGFEDVESLVRSKLAREPIEDLRIDFEDGYGLRPADEEDADVVAAASALRTMPDRPAFCGLRMKSLEAPTRHRAVRTVRLFLDTYGGMPDGFRITLPKVTSVRQVEAMVELAESIEPAPGQLRFEIQIETPQAILGPDGRSLVAPMIHAAGGRCAGLHYGTYDYSASVGIAAAYQSMEHPVADYAKAVMQVAAAGTGVPVSDGSTNILPVGDRAAVHAAWQLHARLVRRSLERGFYQGWDLHPAQLPTRFAATFTFFRDGLAPAVDRLRAYLDRAGGGVLDEPATARALAGYLLRGLECGAVTETEVGFERAKLERLSRAPGGVGAAS